MRVKLSSEAATEMLEAAGWYEKRVPGLGDDFLVACHDAFELIAKAPEQHLHVGRGFRRYVLPRFPYLVFFEQHDGLLVIVAVLHGARNPRRWQKRLGL